MTAVAIEPFVQRDAQLSIERTDLNFFSRNRDSVAIEVAITNQGDALSPPTVARLEAAPLGAFLPWQPLVSLPVPALGPGEVHRLRFEARRPAAKPLGPPDRVTPRQVLTALGFADDRGAQALKPRPAAIPSSRGLPADLMELLLDRQVHWAGNLNVHIGKTAVERHGAFALRVYPGKINMAWFFVGSRPDAYAFRIKGTGPDWNARLFEMSLHQSVVVDAASTDPVPEDRWIAVKGTTMFLLALEPPKTCHPGTVEVHVAEQSTGKVAVVEFSCDAKAAGPGCYVV
jgi:hypothetical protein